MSVAEVAHLAICDRRFEVAIVADEPAATHLARQGLQVARLVFGAFQSRSEAERLFGDVQHLLRKFSPDLILTGLSGNGAGLDEALHALADGIPTFAIQDYWGDVNLTFGQSADFYFVIDRLAAEITRSRCDAIAIIVGAPKYARYAHYAPREIRLRFRRRYGMPPDALVMSWFGQPLAGVTGYVTAADDFYTVARQLRPDAELIYFVHPAEAFPPPLPDYKVRVLYPDCEFIERLAGSDITASCYSSTGLDAAALIAMTGAEGPLSIFVLTAPSLVEHLSSATGLPFVPLAKANLAFEVYNRAELGAAMNKLLTPADRAGLRNRIINELRLGAGAATSILDILAKHREFDPETVVQCAT